MMFYSRYPDRKVPMRVCSLPLGGSLFSCRSTWSCATSGWDEGTAHPALARHSRRVARHSRRQPFCRVFRPGTGCFLLALAWLSPGRGLAGWSGYLVSGLRISRDAVKDKNPLIAVCPIGFGPGNAFNMNPKLVRFEHVRAVCGEFLGLAHRSSSVRCKKWGDLKRMG